MPKPATPQFEYKHFTDPAHREAMKTGITRIIGFAKEKKVGTVVIAGASGFVARELFKHSWKKIHPEMPVPKIFSLGRIMKLYEHEMNAELRKRLGKVPENEAILVLDEMAASGRTLDKAKNSIRMVFHNAPIYTAALAGPDRYYYLLHSVITRHFFGTEKDAGTYIARSTKFKETPKKEFVDKMRLIRQELKQIASEIKPRR